MNTIVVHGYLGGDAETKKINTKNGDRKFCKFNVASRRPGSSDETDWIRCSYFTTPDAKLPNYLVKGKEVVITGRLQVDRVSDEDGKNTRWYNTVIANSIELAGRKSSTNKDDGDDQDDLPF